MRYRSLAPLIVALSIIASVALWCQGCGDGQPLTAGYVLRRGGLLRDYAQAKRLSAATGGAVTIADLCDASPARRRRA